MNSKEMEIDELLQLAREDIARNRLTSAEKTLGQAILMNNQVADAFHLVGYIYSKRGKLKKAMVAFERALALDPLHTEAAIALSSLYNDMGKYKEGASVFLKTKKRLDTVLPGFDPRINQTLAKKHYDTGILYTRYERYKEAYGEFAKALKLEPSSTKHAIRMAVCLSKTGDRPEAIRQLRKLIQLNPKSVEAKIQLGVMYHSEQDLKQAYREWQEALALDPENKSVQMYLSMLETPDRIPSTIPS